jgi:hypothetical protein
MRIRFLFFATLVFFALCGSTPTGALNMTAGVPAGLEEVYALVRQKALSVNP